MATVIEVPGSFRISGGKVEFSFSPGGETLEFSAVKTPEQLRELMVAIGRVGFEQAIASLRDNRPGPKSPQATLEETQQQLRDQFPSISELFDEQRIPTL